jgi:hypothetical protein
MVMTTVHIAIAPSKRQSSAPAMGEIGSFADVVRLSLLGALTFVGGAIGAALAVVTLLAVNGSWVSPALLALPGAGFLAAAAAATLIWLFGAIGTRRTIRRLAPLHELDDRAAFAEFAALLARE